MSDYITPEQVKIKYNPTTENITVDLSGEETAGENMDIDLPDSLYEEYVDENGEVDLQVMWADVYNMIVDATKTLEDEEE